MKPSEAESERGIALFLAVWLVLIVSAMAVGVTREARLGLGVARNAVAAAEARMAAEAGLEVATLSVLAAAEGRDLASLPGERPRSGLPALVPASLRLDGSPMGWRWSEAEVRVEVAAAPGLVDLLTGRPEAVEAALAAARIPRIAERRDAILAARRSGPRIAWHLGARPIDRLSEVRRIAGLSAAEFARLAPFVTLESGLDMPVRDLAPTALRQALPPEPPRLPSAGADGPLAAATWPMTLRIRARAALPEGGVAEAERTVRVEPGGSPALRLIRR